MRITPRNITSPLEQAYTGVNCSHVKVSPYDSHCQITTSSMGSIPRKRNPNSERMAGRVFFLMNRKIEPPKPIKIPRQASASLMM
jgi:hypothetical protein